MDDHRANYKATVVRILSNFQLIEFALKEYIGLAYRLIFERVKDTLHFSYSRKDVESFPLERLINTFSKMNSNRELISRLNRLRAARNQIAHRSLVVTMGSLYDPGEVEDKYIEYLWLEDELAECLRLSIEELRKLKSRSDNKA
jgi:hypothetical protein